MEKIKMPVPIAELDGDEMTHVLWGMIKDTLIKPFVDLNTEYYDLSLPHREVTADAVTAQAAEAIKRLKIGVKCATITPNLQRQEEYGLTQLWKSPNATIRAALDGTVFRAPILLKRVKPVVTCWEKPVTIARHAYGDLYKAAEYRVPGAGKAELVFTDESGRELSRQTVFDFNGPGVVQAMHNRDASILSFARCCFTYALSVGQDVWFGAKDTIPRTMTRPSSCCSSRSMTRNSRPPLNRQVFTTAMRSSTISRPRSSAARAASSGPARTTTAT